MVRQSSSGTLRRVVVGYCLAVAVASGEVRRVPAWFRQLWFRELWRRGVGSGLFKQGSRGKIPVGPGGVSPVPVRQSRQVMSRWRVFR